ncbi:helix-turn-helix domain-containing protein [Lactobacillaceae bacterium 24-114]
MDYLLKFFSEQQPRRIRVIENTLKNKRTVSTLFWAQQYGILGWTGANRSLTRENFDEQIKRLVESGLIKVDNEKKAVLTTKGVLQQEEANFYQPSFATWYWLADTRKVEQRLQLGVQVVSEFAYRNRSYAPLTTDYSELQKVKYWFRRAGKDIEDKFFHDISILIDSLAKENKLLAQYLTYSFSGHDLIGWTDHQAQENLHISLANLELLKYDLYLAVAAFVAKYPGIFSGLFTNLLKEGPLSQSSRTSIQLYNQGMSLDEIAKQRHIALGTVREHILEAAIVCPTLLDFDAFFSKTVKEKLREKYKGDPASWEYDPQLFPNIDNDFFYYRLYQIVEGEKNENR